MHRPFTRRQALENAAFLAALRRTGNARLAARELGVNRSTFTKRRGKSAAFAAEWEAARAAAHAAFHLAGGPRAPEGTVTFPAGRDGEGAGAGKSDCPHKTRGGEPVIVRTKNGRLQLRRSPPGRMTQAGEQAFFRALSASANIRLSAAATGFAHSSFYARKRRHTPFAVEMKISLTIGYDRLECAAMERMLQAMHGGGAENGWLDHAVAGNPIPPLSWDQAFQALCLHRNTVRLDGERPPGRRASTPHNPHAAFFAIARNIDAVERAGHYEATGSWRFAHEQAPPALPPLHLVTGWSKAGGKPKHSPKIALFGGWRIDDWKKRKRGQSI
jgi:hypothetical protein